MESILEGRQVLSDIERSIQNALALFNSRELNDEISAVDNPTISFQDSQAQDSNINTKIFNSINHEAVKTTHSAFIEDETNNYNDFTFQNNSKTHEFDNLPFLENPIKNTVEEIQRVLNAKCDVSQTNEPSPEEILNLYSENLGICLSSNASPRGEPNEAECRPNNSKVKKSDQNKIEKKTNKKVKKQKLKLEHDRTEIKKGNISKTQSLTTQETRMQELMNIYGSSHKMKTPPSDYTLGSKSGVSKSSLKKRTKTNELAKEGSIAPSKKSKRKKQKNCKQDTDIFDENLAAINQSNKLSTQRKTKQKNSTTKMQKKINLKRKIGTNLTKDNDVFKESKSCRIPYRNHNHRILKTNNDLGKENTYRQLSQMNRNNPNQNYKDQLFNKNKGFEYSKDDLTMKNNKTTMDINSKYLIPSDIQRQKQGALLNNQTQHIESEGDKYLVGKKKSEEMKLGRHVLFTENGIQNPNTFFVGNSEQSNTLFSCDTTNDCLLGPTAPLHYTLPTQSSRSKEVERFLNGHYQHLPFVIGQSTNKSHNLWVNIQEALSLIKQKVPQLLDLRNDVHENLSERPLSVLSKLTTKSVKKPPHQCPAAISDALYDIPEVNGEQEGSAVSKSWEDQPECIQANIDPSNVRPRCSCVPQPTLSYKKVLSQIFTGGMSKTSINTNGAREDFLQDQSGDSYIAELRKALLSFTQEFEDLNNKYEEMLSDPNASKEELQSLETQLENKEEEIKEILARYNEVKEVSASRLERSRSRAAITTLEPYKSTTSVRLTQTLRRVQQFKESLKIKPSISFV